MGSLPPTGRGSVQLTKMQLPHPFWGNCVRGLSGAIAATYCKRSGGIHYSARFIDKSSLLGTW